MSTKDKTPRATIQVLGSLLVPITIDVLVTRDDLIESGADFSNMHELTCWLEDIAMDKAYDCRPKVPWQMDCSPAYSCTADGDMHLEIADIGSNEGLDKLAEACADLMTTEEDE